MPGLRQREDELFSFGARLAAPATRLAAFSRPIRVHLGSRRFNGGGPLFKRGHRLVRFAAAPAQQDEGRRQHRCHKNNSHSVGETLATLFSCAASLRWQRTAFLDKLDNLFHS
jgi:hypothetical protein